MHHYNPDWLTDDDVLRGFAARLDDFNFLRGELALTPREGSAQHHLLVGVRGAGKTTMLKRLAVALRRDADLSDHLIALSFPEELYQVKNLADFWWAACDALLDELDRSGQSQHAALAAQLSAAMEKGKQNNPDPLSDSGLQCLQHFCSELGLRPVLLVDNLDMLFERIDKTGRKLLNAHAPAYWALRESLSTTRAPIMLGASVRLAEPFTDVDKAFYDFFIPKRLGKLTLQEVNTVLQRLAQERGLADVTQRLQQHPSRVQALYELTGGNPRALGLIFELLRQGPNSQAVQDFERLMDITTPYYKARFEDLAEQAQVVMHALAVCQPADSLQYGLTAAEVAKHSQLATNSVSAQLDNLAREGLIEKTAAHGRTQYRIAEQLFRLWLQMRGNRRIRQNVLGLTRFLEAMFSLEELQEGVRQQDTSAIDGARLAFAVAGIGRADRVSGGGGWQRGLESKGAAQLMQHLQDNGGNLDDFLPPGDVSEERHAQLRLTKQLLSNCGLTEEEREAFLGSLSLRLAQKQALQQALLAATEPVAAQPVLAQIRQHLLLERGKLLRYGMHAEDLAALYHWRSLACLPLPFLPVPELDTARQLGAEPSMLWRLLGARHFVKFGSDEAADAALAWGRQNVPAASANAWANVAGALRLSGRIPQAKKALAQACLLGETARTWFERAALLEYADGEYAQAELAYRKAIELDPADTIPWNNLGSLLTNKLQRNAEAEQAYREAIKLDPTYARPWSNLGWLLTDKLQRDAEAEQAYRKAIELDPANAWQWNNLGVLLTNKLQRDAEAEQAYRKAIELDPAYARPWSNLGNLLTDKLQRDAEAEQAYRKAIELDPASARPWNNLGRLLTNKLQRDIEAEQAYRKAIELDPAYAMPWHNLGLLLTNKLQRDAEAEQAFRKAIELNPAYARPWNNLGNLLTDKLQRDAEAEQAYRKAIELDPTYALPWNNLGNLLTDKLQRDAEAEQAYRKVIELDPADALPWHNLGWLLTDKLQRDAEAEQAYRKAIELDPADARFWNNLGVLLTDKLQRDAEAEQAYRKAIELDSATALYHYNLARLLTKQEAWQDAANSYARGWALQPDFHPWYREQYATLQARLCADAARQALAAGDISAFSAALTKLLAESVDIALALASTHIVEELLAPALAQHGALIVSQLQALDFAKHARPLLLAVQAVAAQRLHMLDELEPEVQNAARRMAKRLQTKIHQGG